MQRLAAQVLVRASRSSITRPALPAAWAVASSVRIVLTLTFAAVVAVAGRLRGGAIPFFQGQGNAPQGRNQVLLDQVAGSPGGLRTIGQHVQHLGEDAKELPQNPARHAAAAQGHQRDDSHHPPLTPGELGIGKQVLRLVEKEAHAHDQEPELNPERQPAQDLASLPQGSITRCLQRPRDHDSRPVLDEVSWAAEHVPLHYTDPRSSRVSGVDEFIIATSITRGFITHQPDSVITGGEAGLKRLPDGQTPGFGHLRLFASQVGDLSGDLQQSPGSVRDVLHAKRYDMAVGIATGPDQAGQCRKRIWARNFPRSQAVSQPPTRRSGDRSELPR